MARLKKMHGPFIGRLGNIVSYPLNGIIVSRSIGVTEKPPTIPLIASRNVVGAMSPFLSRMDEFIKVGFAVQAKKAKMNANNVATSVNNTGGYALKGVYPNKEVDFTKVLLSMGTIPVNEEITIKGTEHGLEFTWDPNFMLSGMLSSDNFMFMAYCVEKQTPFCSTNGARRSAGMDKFNIPRYRDSIVLEIFTAFRSTKFNTISNSFYHGQLEW